MKRLLALLCAIACLAALCLPVMAAYGDNMVPILAKVPENWDTAYLYTWKGDGQYTKAWPGTEMTQLDDGWYYLYVPGDVENAIVHNNEGVQTDDLKIETGLPVWITVNSDISAKVAYDPQNASDIPELVVELYTVRVALPADWVGGYVWAWDDSQANAFENWPGEKLKRDADGFYVASIPTWANHLLITAGSEGPQTVDLAVTPKDQYIVVGEFNGEKHDISAQDTAPALPAPPEPTVPATQPTEPATQPTEPATQPTTPATQPTEGTQATDPTTGATEATQPAGGEEKPEAKPNYVPLIAAISVGVAAIAAVAVVLLTKKKED